MHSDQVQRVKEQSKFLMLRARRSANLTQVQLAGQLNVSQQMVQQWEDPASNAAPPLWVLELVSAPIFRELASFYAAHHHATLISFEKPAVVDGRLEDEIVDFTPIKASLLQKFKDDPHGAHADLERLKRLVFRVEQEFHAKQTT